MAAKRGKAVPIFPTYPGSSSSPDSARPSSRTTASTSTSSTRDSRLGHGTAHAPRAHAERVNEASASRARVPAASPGVPRRRSPSPSSSEASFADEILLVAPRPRPRPSLAATAPRAQPLPPRTESPEQHQADIAGPSSPPVATRRPRAFDFDDPPAGPHPLSDKAKGKLPLEGERAAKSSKRPVSPRPAGDPKRRRVDMPSSGAEDPVAVSMSPHLVAAAVAEPAPAPVHRRWTPSSAAVSSASSSSSPEHVDVAVQVPLADGGGPSTSRIELDDDGRTSSLDLVSSLQRSAHSTGQHGAAGRTSSLTPAESSPPPLSGARQRARRSPTLSDASSLDTVTAHSPPASTVRALRPAAPDTRLVASNLPARPSRHPLHSLQLHAPPSRPPPRFILNPSFAPATVLGWVQGAAQKKRPPPRPPPRLRTAPPLAVAAPDVAPAVVVDDGQRRSGRAKTQAQLACAIYPPATERIAALAASTSASSSSSRSSSVSVEDPRARASAPLAAAKAVPRKHLMAQLRARYAFLAEDNCAPFRSDNLCDGINPEPCSFEWDDVEVRAAVRVEGWPRWKNADFEMKRDAGEAAELVLRAQAGDESARDEVQAACRVTSWRYLDLDEALGCASNAATGWATRDWRMAQQQQRARGRGLDVVSMCEDPQAFLDALKEDAEPGFSQDRRPLDPSSSLSPLPPSPRKRGSTITDVPPSTPHAPAAVVDADELHDDPALDDVQGADAARRLVISDSDSDSSDDGFDDVRLVRPPHGSAARARARSTASAASSGSSRTNDLAVTPTRSAAAAAPAVSSTGSPTRSTAAAARRRASADASAESAAQVVVDESDAAEDSSSSSTNALDTSRATTASSAALGSTVTATRRPQDSSGSDERSTTAPRRQGRGDGAEVKRFKRSPKPRGKRRTTKRASTGKFIPRAPPARQASSSSSSEDDSSTSGPAKPLSPELVSPDTGVRHKKRSSIKQPAVAATRASSSSTSSASSEQAAPDPAPAPPSPPPAPSKPAQSSSSTPLKPGYKRCAWHGCPNPAYKSTAATSDTLHVANYHESSVVVTWQRPYRTTRLERNEQGLFNCPWCRHKVKNATVARSHAYGRKGCPGPPVGEGAQASSS